MGPTTSSSRTYTISDRRRIPTRSACWRGLTAVACAVPPIDPTRSRRGPGGAGAPGGRRPQTLPRDEWDFLKPAPAAAPPVMPRRPVMSRYRSPSAAKRRPPPRIRPAPAAGARLPLQRRQRLRDPAQVALPAHLFQRPGRLDQRLAEKVLADPFRAWADSCTAGVAGGDGRPHGLDHVRAHRPRTTGHVQQQLAVAVQPRQGRRSRRTLSARGSAPADVRLRRPRVPTSARARASSVGLDRLGEVAVHAGGQTALAVALHGVGRQRDDRRAPARSFSRCRIAAVASMPSITGICTSISTTSNACCSRASTASRPLRDRRDGVPLLLQQADRQTLIDEVVLGQQDAQRRCGGCGLRRLRPAARRRRRTGGQRRTRASSRSDWLTGLTR